MGRWFLTVLIILIWVWNRWTKNDCKSFFFDSIENCLWSSKTSQLDLVQRNSTKTWGCPIWAKSAKGKNKPSSTPLVLFSELVKPTHLRWSVHVEDSVPWFVLKVFFLRWPCVACVGRCLPKTARIHTRQCQSGLAAKSTICSDTGDFCQS